MAGGHSPTNTSYLLSYKDDVKKIETERQDWQSTDIRKEAALRFRPKFRQDKAAFEKEMSNLQEYDGPEFTLKNGEVYYQSYGRTLEELNTRTLEITPEQYSLAQHQTSAMINEAFRNGSTEVVTSYYREGEDHRDLLVMRIDPATGMGKTRIINCARNGNFHEFTSMQSIAKSRFTTHYEIRPANNVFLLSNKPVNYDIAGTKVKEVAHKYENYLKGNQNGHKLITQGLIESSRRSVKEVRATAMSIDAYVQRTYGKRLQDVPMMVGDTLMHRVRRMFEHKEDKKGEALVFQHRPDQQRVVEKVGINKREVQQTRRQVQEKIAVSVATLLFVRATGVGKGGAFVSLESLIRLPQVSLESSKRIRKEKLKQRKYTVEKMRVFRMSEAFKKLTKKEQRVLRRKEKTLRVKENKLFQRKERRNMQRKEKYLGRKERRLLLRKERIKTPQKEKILWEIVRKLVKKGKIIEQKSLLKNVHRKDAIRRLRVANKDKKGVMISKEGHSKRLEKQHIIDFSVALVIWLLLHLPEKRQELKVTKHEKIKEIVVKEPAPWLIFAIIWHLAMIREQGQIQVTMSRPQASSANSKVASNLPQLISVIPPKGIIFAFQ